MNALLRIGAFLVALAAAAAHAAEEHGKTDVFVTRGVALAWAVARGPTEEATFLVIRVATDPAIFRALSVSGRDPFTQAEHVWLPATPAAGPMDVRIPRALFGDFPRTELRFYAALPGSAAAKPELQVFYLGAPDTAPEFDDATRLEKYLEGRIANERRNAWMFAPL